MIRVDDDTDIDELIEMDDSDKDHSDNDLFLTPPPLILLSQEDIRPDTMSDMVQEEPDQIGMLHVVKPDKQNHQIIFCLTRLVFSLKKSVILVE